MLVDEATLEVKFLVAHAENLRITAAMSPDGSLVASVANVDQNWKIWEVESGELHKEGATHDGNGACICEVPGVATEGCPVIAHTAGLNVSAFSPCGQKLATGSLDYTVIMWDAATGQAVHRMAGHAMAVTSISFSADGAQLASGSHDSSVKLWDATSGSLLRTIPQACGEHSAVYEVQFCPTNNRTIVTAGYSHSALWDVESGQRIWTNGEQMFAVFSPDGRTIATASHNDGDVHLVNAETGEVRLRLVGHQSSVFCSSFSVEDGRSMLATGCYDGFCKVWDSSTGELLRSIEVGAKIFSVCWGRNRVRADPGVMQFDHHPAEAGPPIPRRAPAGNRVSVPCAVYGLAGSGVGWSTPHPQPRSINPQPSTLKSQR